MIIVRSREFLICPKMFGKEMDFLRIFCLLFTFIAKFGSFSATICTFRLLRSGCKPLKPIKMRDF